ncbi:MAG TPA: hypothetical protein VJU79_08835 [Candidatus Dormibacteraeota bacterium]|nr:hypothetical protein [Candidatus Dormibacteraeota bacterium]
MANALTDPPFAADPPVKLNVNARILGLVIGILAAIQAIFTLFVGGLLSVFTFGIGSAFIWLLGVLIALVAEILAAVGGFQMYNLNRRGKDYVIYALAIGLGGAIVVLIGQLIAYSGLLLYSAGGAVAGLIIDVIIYGVVYYLVVISRFPGEAPLAPGAGTYRTPPPPPPPSV